MTYGTSGIGSRCPDCRHLLQHHYDVGCTRCDCVTSNTEAGYRAMMLSEREEGRTPMADWAYGDCGYGIVPEEWHHGPGYLPVAMPGDGCER